MEYHPPLKYYIRYIRVKCMENITMCLLNIEQHLDCGIASISHTLTQRQTLTD